MISGERNIYVHTLMAVPSNDIIMIITNYSSGDVLMMIHMSDIPVVIHF